LSVVFDDMSFYIVDKAKTYILPDGDLYMAWKGLLDIPSFSSTRLALKKGIPIQSTVDLDPDRWITELGLMTKRLKISVLRMKLQWHST
jgi:hypothetical protein